MSKPNDYRIAIHHRPGSFSDRWIEYCIDKQISYELVNCYNSDIIRQIRSFDMLFWHWHHEDPKSILFARQLVLSVEKMGLKVFPNINSCWSFDDKIGQKYILEAIGAPLVPSYVFYDEAEALDWIKKTDFPKVFKLRCGAGSTNVRLVKSKRAAEIICNKAFRRGFKPVAGYFTDVSVRLKKAKRISDYFQKIRRMPSVISRIYLSNSHRSREKGYIYFQDFIPNNEYDTRVVVIGNRAFAFRRFVRKNDFRASGSGQVDLNPSNINLKAISISFDIAQKLKTQSVAFDFLSDENKNPLIVEMSYGFTPGGSVKDCPGHWDKSLKWHEGQMWPQDAIFEDMLKSLESNL